MSYLPADGARVTVTRTDCDGHISTWTGALADQRPAGFTLIDADGQRIGFVGAVTETTLASGMAQSVTAAFGAEVIACLAVHAVASVAHCACCGICEDCDATLGVQELPDHELCETCALVADERRDATNRREELILRHQPRSLL